MNKIILVAGLSMLLSGLANAHGSKPLVHIENADKVIIKGGMSHKHKLMMLKCLLMVKKHKTADAAFEAKMAMLKEKCEKHNIDAAKCEKIKHKMAKKIKACFTVHNFMEEFFNKAPANK